MTKCIKSAMIKEQSDIVILHYQSPVRIPWRFGGAGTVYRLSFIYCICECSTVLWSMGRNCLWGRRTPERVNMHLNNNEHLTRTLVFYVL